MGATLVRHKVNVGCFDNTVDGWVNLDLTPHATIARIPGLHHCLHRLHLISDRAYEAHKAGRFRPIIRCNVAQHIPLPDESVEFLYSEHFLEHLYPHEARSFIALCHRKACRGGVIRIAIPDLDRLIQGYSPSCADAFCDAVFESGQRGKNQHHWMYNLESISRLLTNAGFVNVTRMAFRHGRTPDLEWIEQRPDSLIVEAEKGP